MLLAELDETARETSAVWGEIQASAVFEPELREQVREATEAWVALVAARSRRGAACRRRARPPSA